MARLISSVLSMSTVLLSILLFSGPAGAEPEHDYWRNSGGATVWKNSYGECWHDSAATPGDEMAECGDAVGPVDTDGDGVVDADDRCPGTPAGVRVDSRGCELDSDGDGVVDSADQCPDTPRGAPVDARGCPLDSDGDGVADYQDECPDTPAGARVDSRGCELQGRIELRGVNFEVNTAQLTPGSRTQLDEVADTLRRYPEMKIEIAGHTDSSGNAAYNQTLSQRRAEAVRDYLVDEGIAADRLQAKGYGEDKPIADNATRAGRERNRRVELEILQ